MEVFEDRNPIATEGDGTCDACGSYWINGKDVFKEHCPTCQPEKYEIKDLNDFLREQK